jgi:hypothetical protein
MQRIREAKDRLGVPYEVDVVRDLALKQLDFEEELERWGSNLEKARKGLGLDTKEQTILALASTRLEQIRSLLENHVAE